MRGGAFNPRSLRRLALPLGLLIAWEVVSRSGAVDHRFLPSLGTVLARAWQESGDGRLTQAIAASLLRNLAGFAAGAVTGTLFGLALGSLRPLAHALGPSFDTLKQIAVFAWIPLISIWFGMGEPAKIAFIALATFTPCVVNSWTGAATLPQGWREVARVLGFGPWHYLRRLLLPAAAPSIFIGLHLGVIHAWVATIGAEYFLSSAPGIGGLMIEGREHFQMDLVLLGVILLGTLGFILSRTAHFAETRLLSWTRR